MLASARAAARVAQKVGVNVRDALHTAPSRPATVPYGPERLRCAAVMGTPYSAQKPPSVHIGGSHYSSCVLYIVVVLKAG